MDAIDKTLVRLLQRDARSTYHDLGREVGLAANTVADRVRRLHSSGVIRSFRADVDPAALDRRLIMISDIRLRETVDRGEFERGVVSVPQVVAGMRLTGEYDFQLRLACLDPAEFESLVDLLKREHGVREMRSRLLLHDLPVGPEHLLDL